MDGSLLFPKSPPGFALQDLCFPHHREWVLRVVCDADNFPTILGGSVDYVLVDLVVTPPVALHDTVFPSNWSAVRRGDEHKSNNHHRKQNTNDQALQIKSLHFNLPGSAGRWLNSDITRQLPPNVQFSDGGHEARRLQPRRPAAVRMQRMVRPHHLTLQL